MGPRGERTVCALLIVHLLLLLRPEQWGTRAAQLPPSILGPPCGQHASKHSSADHLSVHCMIALPLLLAHSRAWTACSAAWPTGSRWPWRWWGRSPFQA